MTEPQTISLTEAARTALSNTISLNNLVARQAEWINDLDDRGVNQAAQINDLAKRVAALEAKSKNVVSTVS